MILRGNPLFIVYIFGHVIIFDKGGKSGGEGGGREVVMEECQEWGNGIYFGKSETN